MATAEQTNRTNIMPDARWERFQHLLLTLRPGQTVTVKAVAAESGLSSASVEMVLEGLTKAALLHRRANAVYVRQRLQTSTITR